MVKLTKVHQSHLVQLNNHQSLLLTLDLVHRSHHQVHKVKLSQDQFSHNQLSQHQFMVQLIKNCDCDSQNKKKNKQRRKLYCEDGVNEIKRPIQLNSNLYRISVPIGFNRIDFKRTKMIRRKKTC